MAILNTIHVSALNQPLPSNIKDEIDELFIQLKDSHIYHLVIHVHGGLNDSVYAQTMAKINDSRFSNRGRHTINLVWETGVLETICRKVNEAVNTALIKLMLPILEGKLEKYLKASDTSRAKSGNLEKEHLLTQQELIDLAKILESEFQKEKDIKLISTEIKFELNKNPYLSQGFYQNALSNSEEFNPNSRGFSIDTLIPNPARILAQITLSVLKRYMNKTNHGFQETIIEELLREIYAGSFIQSLWDDMKLRAKEMWEKETLSCYFLQKLNIHYKTYPTFRIDLIGHSAGSIVICNMLATAAYSYPSLKFGRVLFLAPAATMEFFYDEIVTKPERYNSFYMFTLTDEEERKDTLIRVDRWGIYRHSLLYLVSGILEPLIDQPISGMMRYLTNDTPFDTHKLRRIRKFLMEDSQKRLILANVSSKDIIKSSSTSHSGFNNDPDTINAIIELLNKPLSS